MFLFFVFSNDNSDFLSTKNSAKTQAGLALPRAPTTGHGDCGRQHQASGWIFTGWMGKMVCFWVGFWHPSWLEDVCSNKSISKTVWKVVFLIRLVKDPASGKRDSTNNSLEMKDMNMILIPEVWEKWCTWYHRLALISLLMSVGWWKAVVALRPMSEKDASQYLRDMEAFHSEQEPDCPVPQLSHVKIQGPNLSAQKNQWTSKNDW